jgi:short-subunit dehydrogenase
MDIANHVFVVTGASMGIGLATAEALTAKGGRVALLARSEDAIQAASARLKGSFAVVADMTDFESVRRAFRAIHSHYGRIDGLVNNAGRSYGAKVEEIDPEAFEEIYRLNVLGPVVAMQAVIPAMRAQGGGAIVNVNSGTAFMTIPGYAVYSSSKRALLGLSLTARMELAADKIVVSEVYPFVTATNFGKNRMGAAGAGPVGDYAAGDGAEFVAGLIVEAIEKGAAQIFANERIREMAGKGG